MKALKVVIDNKIPYIAERLEPFANVCYLNPADITADAVREADALIIRTRTQCNQQLLEGSKIRFIGTATIGFDHIDAAYCEKNGIFWTNAPGCNASSVAQYIAAALCLLSQKHNAPLTGKTIGIVGVGHVGAQVERICRTLGLKVLLNDPPRAQQEEGFVSLDQLSAQSDFITFHTPLSHSGIFKTHHLADKLFFKKLKQKPVILNSSRGEVIDNRALLQALNSGTVKESVMDCWENEPQIDPELLHRSYIATPHIAGYSADGKANGTRMIVEAFARFFGLKIPTSDILAPAPDTDDIILRASGREGVEQAILSTYNPLEDTRKLKETPRQFEQQRGDYPLRREFPAYRLSNISDPDRLLFENLGFKAAP